MRSDFPVLLLSPDFDLARLSTGSDNRNDDSEEDSVDDGDDKTDYDVD